MLITTIVSASLLVSASVNLDAIAANGTVAPLAMPKELKQSKMVSTIMRANDCIANAVRTDPRVKGAEDLRDLIADAVRPCIEPLRTMITTYDQLFGEGEGEAFFMGPFLDELPRAVRARLQNTARQ